MELVSLYWSGPSFFWHREVPCYRGINSLRQTIAERNKTGPEFDRKTRKIALVAIGFDEVELIIRRAIQVLCVVGELTDFEKVKEFLTHPNTAVQKDARTCLFERRIKVKRK